MKRIGFLIFYVSVVFVSKAQVNNDVRAKTITADSAFRAPSFLTTPRLPSSLNKSGYLVNVRTGGNKGIHWYDSVAAAFKRFVDTSELKEMDVFLIGGQSNGVGYSGSTGAANSPNPVAGTVYQYYSSAFAQVTDEVGGANTGSAWPSFGITWYNNTGRRICFVPAAVSGSAQTALAEAGFGTWGAAGTLYQTSLTALNAALVAVKAGGFRPVFRGILWCQGETDGNAIFSATETKTQYKDTLTTMIANYRTQYGANMPFYIYRTGIRTPAGTYEAAYVQIRQAQKEVCDADSLRNKLVFTNALAFNSRSMMVDQYHYSQQGLNEMGRLSAQNIIGYTDKLWQLQGDNSLYYMRGSVGIGTETPSFPLDVADSARVNSIVLGQQGGPLTSAPSIGTNTDADLWLERQNLSIIGLRKVSSYQSIYFPQRNSVGNYPFGPSTGTSIQSGTYLGFPWLDIIISGSDSSHAYAMRMGNATGTGTTDMYAQMMPATSSDGTGNYGRFGTADFEGAIFYANRFGLGGNPAVLFQTNFTTRVSLDSARLTTNLPILLKERGLGATPASTFGALYAKPDGKIYYKNSAATEYDLTGGSTTPTWQSTLSVSAGSTMTANNTIAGAGKSFVWDSLGLLRFTSNSTSYNSPSWITILGQFDDGNEGIEMYATSDAKLDTSWLRVNASGIDIKPTTDLVIRRLTNASSQNRLLGQTSSDSKVGYITVSSPLNITSGVLGITALSDSTFLPTLTNVTNVSSSSVSGGSFHYIRKGSQVTLSGVLTVTPTANTTLTQIAFSLPIASNFLALQDATGTCTAVGSTYNAGLASGDTANDRIQIDFISSSTSAHTVYFNAMYTIK